MVDSSTGLLGMANIGNISSKFLRSWGSKIESKTSSVNGLSDLENIKNTVAKKTNYANLDVSVDNDMKNDKTLRKMCTHTYMLGQPPKTFLFDILSNNENLVAFLSPKFAGSKKILHSVESCASEKHVFDPIKSFALDIETSALPGKTIGNKLIAVKRIFYQIDSFEGASAPSKFFGIIRFFFTSKLSLIKAKEMAISKKILVNISVRKPNSHSDQEVIVKKIPVDLLKLVIESIFSKFEKNSVWVVLAVDNKQSWVSKDQHKVLLYTLPIGITVHDLSDLLDLYGGKTCFIGHNPNSYVCDRCAVVCFANKTFRLAAIGSISVFKNVNLGWAGLSLACCAKYKQFGYIFDVCLVGGNSGVCGKRVVNNQNRICLANIYKKKQAPIICPVSFSNKTWAQVVSSSSSLLGFLSSLDTGLSFGVKFSIGAWFSSNSADPYSVSSLFGCLASLEQSLKLLTDQVFGIVRKLSFVKIVSLPSVSYELPLAVSTSLTLKVNLDMVLDGALKPSASFFSAVVNDTSGFSSSSSKILTTKLRSFSGLWIKNKYVEVRIFTSGLDEGYFGAGIAIVINNFLACHVSKIEVVPGQVILVQLLFKDKLSVSVLSLYTGASAGIHFGQTSEVNFIIAKTVNTSTFLVLDGNFNECRSGRSASFKFCSSLDLVNLFNGHHLIMAPMWCNSRGAVRIIDYIFIISSVSDFFDTDHNAMVVLVSLSRLLDVQLNGLHKQTNKDCWKFKIKDADSIGWSCFRDCSSTRILMIKNRFFAAAVGHDLNTMWSLLEGVLCSKNMQFSKFLDLELLVAKIVKRLESDNAVRFNHFVKKWSTLDADKAFVLRDMVYVNQKMMNILKYLSIVRKRYRKSKIYESKLAQEASIRAAIEKCMKKFCSDKGSMIRSVLNRFFQKVVLNHLVVDDELVLDPDGVRLNYALLNYVRDNAFSGVMDAINMSELLLVVGGLPDEAWWQECDGVPFVSMIPKSYDWDRIFTNTHSITLIETARKIFSKILSDRISFACSKFGVLHDDNFLVLKGTSTQALVFAVGSNMHKAYDFVGWHHLKASLWHIKMCNRFIKFFGSIYEDQINRSEVFSSLLWRIFYDLLLCKIKRHEHLCRYQINTKFVAKSGKVESSGGMFFFFVAGVFVDNTIWIGDCQALMQYALDITSEFFLINNISINSEKTVVIPINQSVKVASLNINGQPISIVKRGKTHRYLGIFLLTESLSKPSLAKTHSDSIVNYRTQFSFVSLNVCHKWDALVKKSLKLKAGLLYDFSDTALHHLSLYGLKFFEQIQTESKLVAVVTFFNALDILGHLFDHRFLDLQILDWTLLDLLQFPVKLHVSLVNKFLTGVVKIFLSNKLFLANNLSCTFHNSGNFSMSLVLRSASYFGSVRSLKDRLLDKKDHVIDWKTFHQWKRLDPRGSFLCNDGALLFGLVKANQLSGLNILTSEEFSDLCNGLLKNFGFFIVAGSAAVYFSTINHSIGIRVRGLMSSTLAELQTVALALKCVPSFTVIDVCVSKLSYLVPNFQVLCWMEKCYIFNLIRKKDLSMSWVKVKDYSGVCGNIKANAAVGILLIAENIVMSGNTHYFIRDMFRSVCWARWKAGPDHNSTTSKVWHPDLHMLTESTSQKTSVLQLYLMKARLYDKSYLGVLCLLCKEVELSDHVFSYKILAKAAASWVFLVGPHGLFFSTVLQFLGHCSSDVGLYSVLYKGFVMGDWCSEAVEVFEVRKVAVGVVVNFVRSVVELHCSRVWLVKSNYKVSIEKAGSIGDDEMILGLSHCKFSK
ncbi:hypothetical protein G9A89_003337 [Geosiphon pyriformis]|nr:hypothetical protein G9A89_003337 [Geosiphon pyriformis]